jgi:hypothetical protein
VTSADAGGSRTHPESLSIDDWSSIRAAYEAGRHSFEPVAEGWRARNPGQAWTTHFDGRRFLATPDHGGWRWGLELRSYGLGDAQQPVGPAEEISAEGQRLAYRREGLEEWWINDTRGLEHGFVVAARPGAGDTEAPLAFHLATVGGLAPEVDADGLGVVFHTADGAVALAYAGLKVWDATGRILPSRFEPGGGEMVRLLVDDLDAVYPVTVDPVAQQAYLKADNAGEEQEFGTSVAVSGNRVVVGAPWEKSSQVGPSASGSSNTDASEAGAAYVFVRNGSTWSQEAYLKAGNADEGFGFGFSVAISGGTIVVGAPGEPSDQVGPTNGSGGSSDDSANDAGAAYVFVRSGTSWVQQAYLKAGNTKPGDQFGRAVAIDGDTIVVGAANEQSNQVGPTNGTGGSADESLSGSGAAYVFSRAGAAWTQQAYLKAGNTAADQRFGFSVGVSEDSVIVGAPGERSGQTGVINSAGGSGDTSAENAGAAYVFLRSGGNWTQQAYLKAGNTEEDDGFGTSVAISGDTAVVGAPGEDSATTGVDHIPGGAGDNGSDSSGAAYVFTRSGSNWSQQAYAKAGNTAESGQFGISVSLSGDTLVVGSNGEPSGKTGVTEGAGGSSDTSASGAGAAYVFRRSGGAWSQRAYLKAGNADQGDNFGHSVGVSGNLVVVGAPFEESGFQGVINGSGGAASSGADDSGAAYVFDLAVAPARLTLARPRFPATAVRKRSRPQSITATNVGGVAATGFAAAVSGAARKDFVLARPSAATLAPGAKRPIRITFAPKRKGTRRALLTVRSSAPVVRASLSGRGR